MSWLRKFRNSVFLVDFLLVLAAIIAIIGLATFVRIYKAKTPTVPASAETLSSAYEKAQALNTIDQTGTPMTDQPSSGGKVEGANTFSDYTCKGNCNLSGQSLKAEAQATCDESTKQQLVSKYDSAVEIENQHYEQEIASKQNMIGIIYSTYNSLISALQPAHQKALNVLKQDLNTSLQDINCKL